MVTQEIHDSLRQASRELKIAEVELSRPYEDVVTLSACQSVRSSMKKMMHYYLQVHDISKDMNDSLDELMGECIKFNPAFAQVDIEHIECKGLDHEKCDGKYCLSIDSVNSCRLEANKLQEVVWYELQVN